MRSEVAVRSSPELLAALVRLREAVGSASLGLETDDAVTLRELRSTTVDQLEDYILPRLVQLDAPLLTVVGGSTGAGKSTLVNSIVGQAVSEVGVLRPTTKSPVLVHHPLDAEWFAPERILPDLERTSSPSAGPGAMHLVATELLPRGIAILDAPDVDSVDRENRALAGQLLAAADLWLFVTSAARYADQVPWEFLQGAGKRGASVAVVLDRTLPDAALEVRGHLARMMSARGLRDSPLFIVPETDLDEDGLLTRGVIGEVRRWMHDLASDDTARTSVISQTLDGAIRQTVFSSHEIADAVAAQEEAAGELRTQVERGYRQAEADVMRAVSDGSLLTGEVGARWQSFVGTGEFMRSLEEKVGRIRERMVNSFRGRRSAAIDVSEAVEQTLGTVLVQYAEQAAERVDRSWAASTAGHALLENADVALDRATPEFRSRAAWAAREWQEWTRSLVRAEAAEKRLSGGFLALGVDGVAAALAMVVFTQQATTTDPTTAAARQLLDSILGEQTVTTLAKTAESELHRRVRTLFADEQRRHLDVLAANAPRRGAYDALRGAARGVDDARMNPGRERL
ncbi:GTPase family protein [Solicola gregarius]|uniref:GTPase domain-containing protein n=1 Tax=Solicola gregarius TaxID=2908642 RepID=A0AA46TFK5_9ACTN|nr:GTPase domain-containing protein [Solicola gregarius]UYM04250.1 GTPase domain-containing protein [Solicola gregarius]